VFIKINVKLILLLVTNIIFKIGNTRNTHSLAMHNIAMPKNMYKINYKAGRSHEKFMRGANKQDHSRDKNIFQKMKAL
jgi:hypothetical protein